MLRHLPDAELWKRPDAGEEIIRRHMHLAETIAGAYRRENAQEREELTQIAYIALLKALRRFDPERGIPFKAWASITISGELKRHFRDGGMVRMSRTLHDQLMTIRDTEKRLGHVPIETLAKEAGLTVEEARAAMAAGANRVPLSLAVPSDGDEGDPVEALLREPHDSYAVVEARILIEQLPIPARSREILRLRFAEDMKQADIAEVMGCSQMHVSRMLRAALNMVRRHLRE